MIAEALLHKYPDRVWSVSGDDYDTLIMHEGEKPTLAQIEKAWLEVIEDGLAEPFTRDPKDAAEIRLQRKEIEAFAKRKQRPKPITQQEKIDAMFDSIVLQDDTKLNELRERVKL